MALTPGFSAFVGSATQEKTYILQQKNINNRRVRSSIGFIMSNLELDRIAHLPEAPTVLDHKPVVTSIIYENLLPTVKNSVCPEVKRNVFTELWIASKIWRTEQDRRLKKY